MSADQARDLENVGSHIAQEQVIGGDWEPNVADLVARVLSKQSAQELALALALALADSGGRGKGKRGGPLRIEPPEPFPRGGEDIDV